MRLSVAGVDGARNGWAVAEWSEDSGLSVILISSIAPLIDRLRAGTLAAVVIDMPIGLSIDGNRPVDQLARARLGVRRSTFFPTPVHVVLEHASWEAANAASRAVCGKGLSKQAWNLVPKIRELDAAWSADVATCLLEGHPEVSFGQMNGSPVLTKKSQVAGHRERLALLRSQLSPDVDDLLAEHPGTWRADAIDALALVWSARRVVRGEAISLGGELGAAGRPMQLAI